MQARAVAEALAQAGASAVELVTVRTSGDRSAVGDKSRFVKELEDALLQGGIDVAVHSAKDVPGALPDGLTLVGAPPAEDARDALVGMGPVADLPERARIGTSSVRRRSQLLAHRPDLDVVPLRGNVDTRLAKLAGGDFDAALLALAGLRRLGRDGGAFPIECDEMVPAPGQGILALEARAGESRIGELCDRLSDRTALSRLGAERGFVTHLDASCHTPVGAHATVDGDAVHVDGYVGLPDGSEWIRDRLSGSRGEGADLGRRLAERMLAAGAGDLLRRAEALAA